MRSCDSAWNRPILLSNPGSVKKSFTAWRNCKPNTTKAQRHEETPRDKTEAALGCYFADFINRTQSLPPSAANS